MRKKFTLLSLLFLVIVNPTFAQKQPKVYKSDLKPLVGSWKGILTYIDYTSNNPYSMPADLQIKQIRNSRSFIFSNLYPDEPKANEADTIIISNNGNMLNEQTITEKTKLKNGGWVVITESAGIDGNDNKSAMIRITYTMGTSIFKIVKEVQFDGDQKWIKRHEYNYTKQ